MNVLVTGGAGYIGSHTVVELIKAGHNPIIVTICPMPRLMWWIGFRPSPASAPTSMN